MLATPGPIPEGPEWGFEVKFDGIRLIAAVTGGRLRLRSRNGKDLTSAFPELAPLASALGTGPETVIDGELIAAGSGPTTLQSVAPRIHRLNPTAAVIAAHPVRYMVFDLMRHDGRDLTRTPLARRRELLTETLGGSGPWQRSEVFDDGPALWQATAAQGWEGVVAKRNASTYQPGVRSRDWIKTAHRTTTDVVLVGWRPESGGRSRIGSLVVAEPVAGALQYAGSVGSGMTQPLSDALAGVLPEIARSSPAVAVPHIDPAPNWVDPVLVVSVRHLGHTSERQLRQPVIQALRPDLTAAELLAEGAS